MPYQEKSCWASLAAIVAAFGVYFARLVPRLGTNPSPPYLGLLFGCVVGLVVMQVVLQAGVAIATREDWRQPRDEREQLIGMKSDRVALVAMAAMFGVVWWLYVAAPEFVARGAVVANLVLFALVLAAIAKFASAIVYFHRGA